MTSPTRTLRFDATTRPAPEQEWLVTNGLGGFASGPIGGGLTRRFHGLLVASLPAPIGRWLCLSHLGLALRHSGRTFTIDSRNRYDLDGNPDAAVLTEFTLEGGLPSWRYTMDGVVFEKRVVMAHGENTAHVLFRLLQSRNEVTLIMRPACDIRPHEGLVARSPVPPRKLTVLDDHAAELHADGLPGPIRWLVDANGVAPHLDEAVALQVSYEAEEARGYDHAGYLWSPGWIGAELGEGDTAAFTVSTEPWEAIRAIGAWDALSREQARRWLILEAAGNPEDTFVAELTLAADQFLIAPVGRAEDAARARAAGDEPRSVIAGYHWFTDWGRDTMISLEGLTLVTGRAREGGCILRTFAHYVRNGLIPNMFPEGENLGLYHTADATLWLFHALHRYVRHSGDLATLSELLPTLVDIAEHHVRGTDFGIGVDPQDGLLRQGAEGYQLTWMDAKVGDWVVTPRRGKAVEINALWYNALRLLAKWLTEIKGGSGADRWSNEAARAARAFNDRFWNPATGCLFDVVDGDTGADGSCRPNQIFAVSLDYPILEEQRWAAIVDVVATKLLTPVGLRTLSAEHPAYQRTYHGDLRTRDAAYHQGTVWPWLIGPFVDAWLKVHPGDKTTARRLLAGFPEAAGRFGIGTLAEIFDAEPPHQPRGCISQAWSVAEVLRAWKLTGTS